MVEVSGRCVLKTSTYEGSREKRKESNFSSREDYECFEVTCTTLSIDGNGWEENEGMREKLPIHFMEGHAGIAILWLISSIVLVIIKIASKVPRLTPERHAVKSYRIYKSSSQIVNWVQSSDPRYPNFPRI